MLTTRIAGSLNHYLETKAEGFFLIKNENPIRISVVLNPCYSATGTYEDMRTRPHHIFGIIRGKPGFRLVKELPKHDQGNQVQLSYIHDNPFFRASFAPENNNYVPTKYA